MPPIGSGPGCPYGLNFKKKWSRTIALKRLCVSSFQNHSNNIIKKNTCQLYNGIARVVQSYFYEMTNEEYAAFGVDNCAILQYEFSGEENGGAKA